MLFGIVEQHFKEDKTALRLRQGGAPIVSGPARRSGPARGRAQRPAAPAAPPAAPPALRPAEGRALVAIEAELAQLIRHDDESIVNDIWARRRYDSGRYPTLSDARRATVTTAWHEAGHAVAALAVGARFRSASIHPGRDTEGRVHGIQASGDLAFVVDAAGQIAERLRAWTLLDDDGLRAWLPAWRGDGGDARRFRTAIHMRFGTDEFAAWRHSESLLTPLRPKIRHVARALLVHPRHIPHPVVAALAADS
jgi:hypothetical protein